MTGRMGYRLGKAASLALLLAILAPPALAVAETVDLAAVLVRDGGSAPRPLADLVSDKPVILHFWATWCVPCRDELPKLDAFAAELATKGDGDRLLVISVDTRPHDGVAGFLKEIGATHLRAWQVASGNAGTAFRIFGYPATLVLQPDGSVARRLAGPIDWDDAEVRAEMTKFLERR
ncbi:TlpA family protein disulfide reductase [Jiella endophytica]|uniref:TlpA family protein disulfide reductase n=1 Tax=Jiella endophytica TaxID=2558362 RepID=A0A4Y8RFH8_9HYPH|nr:TlpA disulfide reductase family protein [Jiella endophytica]TFF20588.1 TlpA family protein disulfide reductase [Jiella endophytica]